MMTLLRGVAEEGVGVLVVVHDLNLAARYAHEILVLKDGTRRACGAPTEILRPEVVEEAFGVPVAVVSDPVHGGPLVLAQDPTRASRPPERRSVAAGSIHEPSPRYDP
jgi:iron complex transport system ATP-binding protein